jgi:hypothetical protein
MRIRKSPRPTTIAIAIAAAAATSLVPFDATAFFRMGGGMGRGMTSFHQSFHPSFHPSGQAGTFAMGGSRRMTSFQRWPRTGSYGVASVRHPTPYPEGRGGTGGNGGRGGNGGIGGRGGNGGDGTSVIVRNPHPPKPYPPGTGGQGGTGGRGGNGGSDGGNGVIVHNGHPRPPFTIYPSYPTVGSGTGSSYVAASVGPLATSPMPSPSNRPARLGGSGVPPSDERRYVFDEIMTEMIGNPNDQTFEVIRARHNLNPLNTQRIALTNSTWVHWRIVGPRRSVTDVIRALEADNAVRDLVLSIQPNYVYTGQQDRSAGTGNGGPIEPADDFIQYALAKLHLPEAQALALGNRIVVAVIDTEIDKTHRELAGAIINVFDALGTATPMEAHGTGIAGIIAAHAKLTGAAPAVRILAIRALGNNTGTTDTVIKGLDYAVAHDARVINMSFTGPADPALTRALASAHARGRILIAAVGNKGPNSPALFPAADPNVIAVTATDAKDRLFAGANRGDHVAIAAPGVDILVPAPGNAYTMSTGTSFASAYVAGVAALLVERSPNLTPDAVKNILMSTAHHLGPKGRDALYGAGLMDANQAILSVNGRSAAGLTSSVTH